MSAKLNDMDRVRAWRPAVAGVAEVFHAEWRDHAYPPHTHDTCGFLATGIAAAYPQLVGDPYEDADGEKYLRLFGMPILVFEASADDLKAARARARQRQIPMAVYTYDMFATGHDAANRRVVAAVPGDELDIVGIAVHAAKNAVDKVLKGARLHP